MNERDAPTPACRRSRAISAVACFSFLSILSSAVIAGAAEGGNSPQQRSGSGYPAAQRPNFVVILADDLGFSDLGCYGGEIDTPTLDRLAGNGVRFTNFYNTGRCWPTRTCLYTGYYSRQVNGEKRVKGAGFPVWAAGLPRYLSKAGYHTYLSGKWHILGRSPEEMGFEKYLSSQSTHNHFAGGIHSTVRIVDNGIKLITEHRAKYPEAPFYVGIDLIAPHFPLMALPEDIQKYRGRYNEGWAVLRAQRAQRAREIGIIDCVAQSLELGRKPDTLMGPVKEAFGDLEPTLAVAWDSLSPQAKAFQAEKMAVHAAMVHQIDRECGRLVETLASLGLIDDTVLLFLSDNGASAEVIVRGGGHKKGAAAGSADSFLCLGPGWASASNSPLRRFKCTQSEGGIATPFIVHWPAGNLPKGALHRTRAHAIDLLPTFLELAGVKGDPFAGEGKPPLPGISLVPAFRADRATRQEALFFDHGDKALIKDHWKLISESKGGKNFGAWQLYDLKTDRGETRDVAAGFPEVVQELDSLWQEMDARFEQQVIAGQPARGGIGADQEGLTERKSLPDAETPHD